MRLIILVAVIMVPISAFSADISKDFPALKEIKVNSRWNVKVLYNPKISKVINSKQQSLEPDIDRWDVVQTRLTEQGEEYLIEFNEGHSDDPQFRVLRLSGKEPREVFMSFGTGLVIPGDGTVYLSGHTNNTFDERKKFEIKNHRLTEVKQPFMYVGLNSKTTKDITLYSTIEQQGVVAHIPAGASVSVVLNNGDDYLVKTPFGLLGWTKIPVSNTESIIEGIVYAGD